MTPDVANKLILIEAEIVAGTSAVAHAAELAGEVPGMPLAVGENLTLCLLRLRRAMDRVGPLVEAAAKLMPAGEPPF